MDGLGAVLSHDPQKKEIVHCASRTLAPAERNYSNVEREALGVIFGIKRFHQYLAGRKFIVQTDHHPLKALMDNMKPIQERISMRLQRWSLFLKGYDFSIQTIKGEEMLLPDLLSRISSNESDPTASDITYIALLLQEDQIPLFDDIQIQTKTSILQKVIRWVQHGWPKFIPRKILPYTKNKIEYTVHNGCLYRGHRIVVAPALRKRLLHIFHEYHPGITKMRQLLRQFVWWPGLDGDVQKLVSSCEDCAATQSSRVNCSLASWPDCSNFFDRVHLDLFF